MGFSTRSGKLLGIAIGAVLIVLTGVIVMRPSERVLEFGADAQASEGPYSDADYAWTLKTFVDDDGMVAYAKLAADRDSLASESYRVSFLGYDWTLNEQASARRPAGSGSRGSSSR